MTDLTGGDPEQAIRLFFSMDLSGASKYKYSHPPAEIFRSDENSWPSFFIEFFNQSGATFWDNMRRSCDQNAHGFYPIEFWKTLGDEILFFSTQTSEEQPYWQLRAFLLTVQQLHRKVQEYTSLQLGVKGVIWSAGFPIRNKRLFLDQSNGTSVYEGDEETLEIQTGARPAPGAVVDFMGLEMDQGFRLASHAVPGRVVASPDACYLAAKAYSKIDAGRAAVFKRGAAVEGLVDSAPEFRVLQVGWESLRGVLGDLPVPILWPECVKSDFDEVGKRQLPYSFDSGRSKYWSSYLHQRPLSAREFRDFFEHWNSDLEVHGVSHIKPYVKANKLMDEGHKLAWDKARQTAARPEPTIISMGDKK